MVAEPSVGVAWAKRVPVMSPLVRGRKVMANWQEALGASAAQGGLARTNWRGRAMSRGRGFAVGLLMMNSRVAPRVVVGAGPKLDWLGRIWRPEFSVVYAPVRGTV